MNEYFLPGDGIDREVVMKYIVRFLGPDALVRRGIYEGKKGFPLSGYIITAPRNLTTQMVDDLKKRTKRQKRKSNMYKTATVPTPPAFVPPRSLKIVKHLKPSRKCLPVLLNGQYHEACADFGSERNIISKDLADNMGHRIMENVRNGPVFRLPTGRLLSPCGRTLITCQFPDESVAAGTFEFYLFLDLAIPLILGKGFLRETRTLDQNFHRLRDILPPKRDLPLVAFMGDDNQHQKEQISFWLNGEKLNSTPDTGSDLNLISLEFALRRGYYFDPHKRQQMQFADRSKATARVSINLNVSFGGDGLSPMTLLELVDISSAELQIPPGGGKISYGTQTAISAEFHIVENLQVEVLLGIDVIATVDAFVQHNREFMFTPAHAQHDLFLTEQLSDVAMAWANSRLPNSSPTLDRVQQLLVERYKLIEQDETLKEISAREADSLFSSQEDKARQANEYQNSHRLFRLRLGEIDQEIMAEHTRSLQQSTPLNSYPLTQSPNLSATSNNNLPIATGNIGYSGPFISAVPSNYQLGQVYSGLRNYIPQSPLPTNFPTPPLPIPPSPANPPFQTAQTRSGPPPQQMSSKRHGRSLLAGRFFSRRN